MNLRIHIIIPKFATSVYGELEPSEAVLEDFLSITTLNRNSTAITSIILS